MSLCWERVETVRIEQPVDYVRERPAKMTPLGIIFSAIGWGGFIWLMWCVLARVAR